MHDRTARRVNLTLVLFVAFAGAWDALQPLFAPDAARQGGVSKQVSIF